MRSPSASTRNSDTRCPDQNTGHSSTGNPVSSSGSPADGTFSLAGIQRSAFHARFDRLQTATRSGTWCDATRRRVDSARSRACNTPRHCSVVCWGRAASAASDATVAPRCRPLSAATTRFSSALSPPNGLMAASASRGSPAMNCIVHQRHNRTRRRGAVMVQVLLVGAQPSPGFLKPVVAPNSEDAFASEPFDGGVGGVELEVARRRRGHMHNEITVGPRGTLAGTAELHRPSAVELDRGGQ